MAASLRCTTTICSTSTSSAGRSGSRKSELQRILEQPFNCRIAHDVGVLQADAAAKALGVKRWFDRNDVSNLDHIVRTRDEAWRLVAVKTDSVTSMMPEARSEFMRSKALANGRVQLSAGQS